MKTFRQHISSNGINKILDEEYEILRRDLFREQLDEKLAFTPKWSQSAFVHVLSGHILISDKVFKLMSDGQTARGTVWHTTSDKGLKALYDNQRSKKTISVRTVFDHEYGGSGIWHTGYAVKLQADILFGGGHDIMSMPDESGRRWIRPMNFSWVMGEPGLEWDIKDMARKFLKPFIDRVRGLQKGATKDDGAVIKTLADDMELKAAKLGVSQKDYTERSADKFVQLNSIQDPTLIGMIKQIFKEMVTKYITVSKKMIGKYFAYIRSQITKVYTYSNSDAEFLANNFVIEDVMITEIALPEWLAHSYNKAKKIFGKRRILFSGYADKNARSIGVKQGYAYELKGNPDTLGAGWHDSAEFITDSSFDKASQIKFDNVA